MRAPSGARAAGEVIGDLVVLAIVAVACLRLASMAAGARFVSDECFHAHLSEWIAAHGRLPHQVDGLYGGFKYFYPPLYHLLGALTIRLFDPGALKFLSLALLAGLLALAWSGLARMHSRAAGRVGTLLLLSFTGLLLQSTRVYVETLTALLAVATLFALLALARRPGWPWALVLGVLAGLGELAKQSGLAVIALIGGLAVVAALRKQSSLARPLALATVVAAAVASPYWIRNTVLFGSPLYPLFGADVDPRLMRMNQVGFTPGAAKFYATTVDNAGSLLACAVPLALVVAWRRRSLEQAALWGVAILWIAAPLVPMFDWRHAIPLVACMAVLASAVLLSALREVPALAWAAQLGTAAFVAFTLVTMPNLRAALNLSHDIDPAFNAIRREVPKDATILCIETYETFYHTGRRATWPIPYGQEDPPVEFFFDREPERILAHLRGHGIDYLLVPPAYRGEAFNSANFPRPFMQGLDRLVEEKKVTLVWNDALYLLLRVVPAAAGAGR